MTNLIENQEQLDNFIKDVGGAENFEDLKAKFGSGNSGAGQANEFFTNLTNQIGQQFVQPMVEIRRALRDRFYKTSIQYGDYFEFYWNKIPALIKYDTSIFTPEGFIKAGGTYKLGQRPKQVEQSYIKIMSGAGIDEKLVRAIFTGNTIPAFNTFINQIMSNYNVAFSNWFYDFEIKILKMIKNTYIMKTDYPKPADITNKTQWKLAYIATLIERMGQKSKDFSAAGRVGQQNPEKTSGNNLTDDDLPLRTTTPERLTIFTSPRQKAEFKTFGYATIFNEQEITIKEPVALNIDKAQSANSIIDKTISNTAKLAQAAATADDYQTAYIVDRDAIAIIDRFEVRTSSTWLLGQLFQTLTYFGTYCVLWKEIAIKVDLRTA